MSPRITQAWRRTFASARGSRNFRLFLSGQFISAIVISIDNPARQSFYVEMVGEGTLTNAVSLNSAAFTGARIIGPAVAGILIATVGMAICFLIDGISYLAVLAALLAMHGAEMHMQRRSSRERGHLAAGLRYVWETDALRKPQL